MIYNVLGYSVNFSGKNNIYLTHQGHGPSPINKDFIPSIFADNKLATVSKIIAYRMRITLFPANFSKKKKLN